MPYFLIQAVQKIRPIARVWMTRAIVCLSSLKKVILLPFLDTDHQKRRYVITVLFVLSLLILIIVGINTITNSLKNLNADTTENIMRQDWWYDEITTIDIIIYVTISIFIILIVWISNQVINKIIDNQNERLTEMEHSIRIGELSCGIIHDIINPLLSISLCVEELDYNSQKYNSRATHIMIEAAVNASHRMKKFIESAHCTIDPHRLHENTVTNLHKEIKMVCDMFAYKARMSNVHIITDGTSSEISLPFHPLRIHQILINLISNALDACTDIPNRPDRLSQKYVRIDTKKGDSYVKIFISDNGCGMTP